MITATCLALAAYHEAREHYTQPDAMAAVVAVVMNRVEDERYADDACAVIASGAFPWYTSALHPETDGAPDAWAWLAAIEVAEDAFNGRGLNITSTHFHTAGVVQYWASEYEFDGCYGDNCFYTNETEWK